MSTTVPSSERIKNLLIFIHPQKRFFEDRFGEESVALVKIQIDNCLRLGWQKEDILLVTNFDYEYKDVKALVIGNENYCVHCPQASKINAIVDLFARGYIEKEWLYWFHDFDAFQLEPVTEAELGLGAADMGLTDYGRFGRWSTGSIFFRQSARDLFTWIRESVYENQTDEERALGLLTKDNVHNINDRIKKINLTYNFTAMHIGRCYEAVTKPIRMIHFHPLGNHQFGRPFNGLAFFMHGENSLHQPLMTTGLMEIFKNHGIASVHSDLRTLRPAMTTLDFIVKRYGVDLARATFPIPLSWSRWHELGSLFNDLQFRKGVELGVYKGRFTARIAKRAPKLELIGIDAWTLYPGYKDYVKDDLEEVAYAEALARTKEFTNVRLVKDWSLEVVTSFSDESLDFVYIDASHDYESVKADIAAWSRKVRKGGLVMGHDYFKLAVHNFGVVEAVNEWCKDTGITYLFTTADKYP